MESKRTSSKREKIFWQRKENIVELDGLVEQAIQGGRSALLELCRKISKNVLFSVQLLLPGHQDAEDIAQEILIRVCENIHSLKRPKAFGAWLNSIVENETRRWMGRAAKRTGHILYLDNYLQEVEQEHDELQPDTYVLDKEESEALMKIVATLPDRQREAVMWHYYKDMSVMETAIIMGITHPGVSKHLKMARENICEALFAKAKRTGRERLRMLAAAPIGPLLTQAFHMEAENFTAPDEAWVQKAMDACARHIGRKPATMMGAKGTTSSKLIAGIIAAVAIPLMTISLLAGGISHKTAATASPESATQIAFTGGDAAYRHLNPEQAKASLDGEQPLDGAWEITREGDGNVLYSGNGTVAAESFALLSDGIYRITFTMRDGAGQTYMAYGNFQIRRGSDE